MKYMIVKKTIRKLVTMEKYSKNKHVDIETNVWYIAKRKGRIFGFWHSIGHEYNIDDIFPTTYAANTIEEIEDYIRKWHSIHYSKDKNIEIIRELNIET